MNSSSVRPISAAFLKPAAHLLHPFGRPGLVEDSLELVEVFLRDAPHRSRSLAVQISPESLEHIVQMLLLPLPDLSGLGMSGVVETPRIDAVAVVQDVGTQVFGQQELLAAFLGLDEIAQFYGQVAQSHHNQPGSVLPRTSRHTAHALAAVPDRVAFEQFLDFFLILALDDVHNPSRVIAVELRRRADGRAGAAVDARVQAFLQAVVLH